MGRHAVKVSGVAVVGQDLISRLLERKPTRRLGMLNGRAADIKRHKWFEGLDWEALEARKVEPPRRPRDDSAKRLRELTVRLYPIDFYCTLERVVVGFVTCTSLYLQATLGVEASLDATLSQNPHNLIGRDLIPLPIEGTFDNFSPHREGCSQEGSSQRNVTVQDNERKQKREPKETPEELQECEMVFADF